MSRKTNRFSRRNFVHCAALAGLAGVPGPTAAQDRLALPPLPAPDQAEVDARYAHLLSRYGDRLNDEQKTRAKTVLARHQQMLKRVREFPLENGDAPATVLRLYPKDLKE